MATLDVVNVQNQKAGSVEMNPAVFEAPVRPHLFHAEVRRQLAKRRAGTHSTKNRHTVSGGGSKPWRQKGTGRARQGTNRAPQWAGGGVVFGPVPRKYDHSLNKKTRRAALRGAVSQRLAEGKLLVVDSFDLSEFKTKRMAEILGSLGLAGQRVLIVLGERDEHVERSAKNLAKVGVIRAEGLNVYDVLRHEHLVLTRSAVDAVDQRLTGGAGASAGEESE